MLVNVVIILLLLQGKRHRVLSRARYQQTQRSLDRKKCTYHVIIMNIRHKLKVRFSYCARFTRLFGRYR